MDASLLPVSLPSRSSFVARNTARAAPVIFLAGLAAYLLARSAGLGGISAHGLSEAIPLNVSAPNSGQMKELLVTVGQSVKAGDVIARLDGRMLDVQRRQNLAEQALLETKVFADRNVQEASVMRAEVWRLRTVANAQFDEAALTELNKEVSRLNSLLDENLVKASEVEPRIQARDALAARVGTFERARAAGQAGLETKVGNSSAALHKASVELRIAPDVQALRVNEVALAQIDLQISMLTLRAPADGVVSAINARPGEFLQGGQTAVVIASHRPGVFEIYLPAREHRVPGLGSTVQVSGFGLLSRNHPARVIEVGPTIVQLPQQLWTSKSVPAWGRLIRVDASAAEEMRGIAPGEEVRARI